MELVAVFSAAVSNMLDFIWKVWINIILATTVLDITNITIKPWTFITNDRW